MVKDALIEGFDTSRLIISTTITKDDGWYVCDGRVVQGRGVIQKDGEVDWDDRVMTIQTRGEDPAVIESLALENLLMLMSSKEFYLFEEEDDDSEDDIQEV